MPRSGSFQVKPRSHPARKSLSPCRLPRYRARAYKAVAHILRAPRGGPIVGLHRLTALWVPGRCCSGRGVSSQRSENPGQYRQPHRRWHLLSHAPASQGMGCGLKVQAGQHAFGRDGDCLFCTNCRLYRLISAASFGKPILQPLAAGTSICITDRESSNDTV